MRIKLVTATTIASLGLAGTALAQTPVPVPQEAIDGTWLIRSKGTVDGRAMHFGRVCTADGHTCVRWDVEGAKHARKDVRAAASKLRRR